MRGVITEALEEFRARHDHEGNTDLKTLTAKVATDNLDRSFRYKFLPDGKPGWYPISFQGLEYTDDGLITSVMTVLPGSHGRRPTTLTHAAVEAWATQQASGWYFHERSA